MSGGPSHIDLFDYKPKLREYHGAGTARLDPHGPADHRHDLRAEVVSLRRADVRVRAARQVRRLGQRAVAAHRRDRRRHCDRQDRSTPRRSTTTRPSPTSRPAASSRAGRASGPGSATAWAARTSNLPAFVVMISQGSGNKTDQPIFSRLWGSGFLPSAAPGRALPHRRRSGALSLEPAGRRSARRAAACSTASASSTRLAAAGVRRSGDQHAHRPVRDGLPHADLACRS